MKSRWSEVFRWSVANRRQVIFAKDHKRGLELRLERSCDPGRSRNRKNQRRSELSRQSKYRVLDAQSGSERPCLQRRVDEGKEEGVTARRTQERRLLLLVAVSPVDDQVYDVPQRRGEPAGCVGILAVAVVKGRDGASSVGQE